MADRKQTFGQQRNVKTPISNRAGTRRRHHAIEIAKERRESLLKSKRVRLDNQRDGESSGTYVPAYFTEETEETKQQRESDVRSTVESLHSIIRLRKGSNSERISLLTKLRQLLSSSQDPPIRTAVESGVIPLLIDCLGYNVPQDQLTNSVWCLANIASGPPEISSQVLPASAILISLMGEGSPAEVAEQCAWAVANLAGEGSGAVEGLLKQGALGGLSRLVLMGNADVALTWTARTAAWALSNLLKFSGSRVADELALTAGMPEAMTKLLARGHAELAAEVAWVLAYLTARSDKSAHLLLRTGVAIPLVHLAASTDSAALLTPVVRTLGNLTAMDDSATDIVLSAGEDSPGGTLGALSKCLNSTNRAVQKESSWALSNIAGGSANQKRAFLDSEAFPTIIQIFKNSNFDIKREAGFALANLCVACPSPSPSPSPSPQIPPSPPPVVPQVLSKVVQEGCLAGILSLVRSADVEASRLGLQMVELILRALPGGNGPKIVEQMEGIDALESLQFHENDQLRIMANSLVDTYFGENYGLEDEDYIETNVEDYPQWRGPRNL